MRKTHSKISTAAAVLLFSSLFAVLLLGAASQARADEYAYQVTSTGQFGSIDLNTGTFTPIANLPVTLCGLAVYQGKIYGYGCGTGTLYQVSPVEGAETMVGSAGFNYRGIGSTSGGLYGFDQKMKLYSINPANGDASLIGLTGLPNPSGFGVSSGLQTLYITPTFFQGCSGTWLLSVNVTTGRTTVIGLTGVCGIGAMLVQDGTLYAGGFSPTAVYTLNPQTAQATFVANVTGTTGYFYGLTPAAQVAP